MTQWTYSAKTNLETYFERMRANLEASGADAAEVTDDLRRHIDEEIAATKLRVVTEEDVRRILARIGAPQIEMAAGEPKGPPAGRNGELHRPPKPVLGALLFFGVFLPALTLGIEWLTHMCAGTFFDPIPTGWHALLVALVPMANLLAWWAIRENKIALRSRIGLANGFALGISLFYAFLYLPLLPFALVGVVFLGFGLLPLSPLLAFISALRLRVHLGRMAETFGCPGLWKGAGLAAAALAVIAFPPVITRHWSHLAASEDPEVQTKAIKLLRTFGHKKTLLADCYGAPRWSSEAPFGPNLLGTPANTEAARNIYFRVTGDVFNSVPPPQLGYSRGGWNFLDEFAWDSERGGDAVGGRVRGLSLAQSRMDGLLDPDAAWGYVEWTLEFKNIAEVAREARAQIALPPGGVVSRLTLWVNGEEREAAFAGRSQVREAYRQVAVVQKRDPVLVTSCGLDRVLMQCFPVPPSGTIKVRLGITLPLILQDLDKAAAKCPSFLERNFSIPQHVQHSLWIESRQPMEAASPKLVRDISKASSWAVHGQLTDSELSDSKTLLRATRSRESNRAWVTDHGHDDGGLIWQSVEQTPSSRPGRAVFVIDGARNMGEFYPQIAASLKRLAGKTEVVVILAQDGVEEISDSRMFSKLQRTTAAGGHDNIPALVRGWDLAAAKSDGVIIWIHGPQPVLLENVEALKQRLEWRGANSASRTPLLYDLQTKVGPNRLVEKLDGIDALVSIPRLGSVEEDLDRVFTKWDGGAKWFELVRTRVVSTNVPVANRGKESSKHLARLWAYDEIRRLISSRRVAEAIHLAGSYQLVTPVSGAVVLETVQQFQQAGLMPVDSNTVPTVPEPKGLFALALLMVLAWKVFPPLWKKCRRSSRGV